MMKAERELINKEAFEIIDKLIAYIELLPTYTFINSKAYFDDGEKEIGYMAIYFDNYRKNEIRRIEVYSEYLQNNDMFENIEKNIKAHYRFEWEIIFYPSHGRGE
jgi:hypothetical protein